MELRDPDQARQWLLHGLRLVRVTLPDSEDVAGIALAWSLEMANEGYGLPPIGALADLGLLGLSNDWSRMQTEFDDLLPRQAIRRYEDYVTGKFISDSSFRRGTDAVLTFPVEQQGVAFAFLMHRVLERARFDATILSPSVIRGLQREKDLAELMDGADDPAVFEVLAEQYTRLTECCLRSGDALAMADILELERGIAVSGYGQRLAFRQVIEATEGFRQLVPKTRPRARLRRQEIATSITEHDAYPVGGFGSITSHGSLESLLNSQLAYMDSGTEPSAGASRPDLFDIKFLRGELLYYSRDENQFLRRRYRYSFLLSGDLVNARLKRDLPWQDVIAVLACCYTAVRQLTEWLSTESLHFEFVVMSPRLQVEESLLELLFRDMIAGDLVSIRRAEFTDWMADYDVQRTRARCRAMVASYNSEIVSTPDHNLLNLTCGGALPTLRCGDGTFWENDDRPALDAWQHLIRRLLEEWV